MHEHLSKHKDVHGIADWTLKNHLSFHIAKQYEEDKQLPNTFVTERRHKDPKRFVRQALRMTKGLNRKIMEELVCQHFFEWRMSEDNAEAL